MDAFLIVVHEKFNKNIELQMKRFIFFFFVFCKKEIDDDE